MNKNQTSSIEEEAVATISGQSSYSSIEYNQPCNVRLPNQTEKLCIDLQDINQMAQICEEAKRITFSWSEMILALAMLCLGAELGCWDWENIIPSSFTLWQGVFLVLGFSFLVAYFFTRREQNKDVKHFALRIEDIISRCTNSYSKKEDE